MKPKITRIYLDVMKMKFTILAEIGNVSFNIDATNREAYLLIKSGQAKWTEESTEYDNKFYWVFEEV